MLSRVDNNQIMATWRKLHHGGMAVGTRRPTAYPEWVTLEVGEGGFATGRALANCADGEQSSTDFMAKGGIATLEDMLSSSRYRIDQPENAALLVLVWLLQQGRNEEASALFTAIAPYMDDLRFYPHHTDAEPSSSSVGASTVAAVSNVGTMRSALQTLKRRNEAFEADSSVSYRRNQQRRQRAVAEGYAQLQGDAIELLLSTVPNREAFLELDPANTADVETAGKLLFKEKGRDEKNRTFEETVASIISRADEIVTRYGSVTSHQRPSSTTSIVISALRSEEGSLFATNRCAVARRILEVAKSRGVKGTEKFAKYLVRTAASAIPEQYTSAKADAVLSRVARLPAEATIPKDESDILLKPFTSAELNAPSFTCRSTSPLPLPPSIDRIIKRAVADTLESMIKNKVIVSAEMISSVLPGLLSASAGACIEDDAARTLYAQLTVSFSKRRSLLLVNHEKQVRLEELPWARPILSLLIQATDEDKQCDAVVCDVVRCYFTYFPATSIPNKVVGALKDVMRKGVSSKANLMEELAADTFQDTFSTNFDAAAFVASKLMRGTVYSRYYDLDAVYKTIEEDYPKLQADTEALRQDRANANKSGNKKENVSASSSSSDSDNDDSVDYYVKAREKSREVYYAYTAETGKVLHQFSRLVSNTPRGNEARHKMIDAYSQALDMCAPAHSAEMRDAEGSSHGADDIDMDAVESLTTDIQTKIAFDYREETGCMLNDWQYLYPDYDEEATRTPRAIEACVKIIDIESKYCAKAEGQYVRNNDPFADRQREIDQRSVTLIAAKQKMADWQMPHDGTRYDTVQSGRTIEAAMIITTHNLAQLADVYSTSKKDIAKDIDFEASVIKVWTYIVSKFVNPPMGNRRTILHARRDVAYAWRQALCLISLGFDGADAQRKVLEKMRDIVKTRASTCKVRPEAAEKLETHFLTPLEAVIGGTVHKIADDVKVSDGDIVLGFFGWRSFDCSGPSATDSKQRETDEDVFQTDEAFEESLEAEF